jgi:hypothetical protein
MPSNKTTAIIEMLAIGFGAPLLGLGILAVGARIWKPDLREISPWLRAFRWIRMDCWRTFYRARVFRDA